MNGGLLKVVEGLDPGDLACCEWCDASTGKSSGTGVDIDLPVRSWGVFIGLFGEKIKHIVLAHNCFYYSDGFFDLAYTAIPLSWTVDASVILKAYIPRETASKMVRSFQLGGRTALNFPGTYQKGLSMHGRPH